MKTGTTVFEFQQTHNNGDPIGELRQYKYSEIHAAISLRCPGMNVKRLKHFIDLAVAAKGGPVDVSHWVRGAMVWSARIRTI